MIFRWYLHRIFLLEGSLYSKLQHYGSCKKNSKNSKASHSNCSGYIEDDILQNHEKKKIKKLKEVKNQDLMDKKTSFLAHVLQPLADFSHMATYRRGKAIVRAWNGERGSLILIFYFFLLLHRKRPIYRG
jgi:hypothetical protein